MPFKYSVEQNRLIFTPLSTGCGRVAFLVLGIIFTIIGVLLILFNKSTELPFSMIKWIVPLFGGISIYAGIAYPKHLRVNQPDQICFDNENGRIEITQSYSDIQTAFIYYDEISDFIIKTKSHSSSSKKTYYTYHIHLQKKDGGQWELMKLNTYESAEEEIEKIKSKINFSAMPVRVNANASGIKKINISEDHVKAEISWQNQVGAGPVFLFLFAVLFLTIFWSLFGSPVVQNDFGWFGYLIGGFMFIVFVFVIGSNALKMIKNAQTIYAVIITDSVFAYVERDKSGRIKNTKTIPLSDLHAISFSYNSEDMFRKIFIYTHDQFEFEKKMDVSFKVSSIKAWYNFYKSLLSLELHGLTAVEMLHLENYLQQQIRDRGKVVAL